MITFWKKLKSSLKVLLNHIFRSIKYYYDVLKLIKNNQKQKIREYFSFLSSCDLNRSKGKGNLMYSNQTLYKNGNSSRK